MKANCESRGKEFDSKHFYDRDCSECKVVELPAEAHVNFCEGCGSKEVAYFDKEGFYVFCQDCYDAAVSPKVNHPDNLPFVRARYLKIVVPTRNDFESAYRQLVAPGTEIDVDKVFTQLEANAHRSAVVLKMGWRDEMIRSFGEVQI